MVYLTIILTALSPLATWLIHVIQSINHHERDAIDFLKEFDQFTRITPNESIGSRYIQEYFSAISGAKVSIHTIRIICAQKNFLVTLKKCQRNSKTFLKLSCCKPTEERDKALKSRIRILYLLGILLLLTTVYLQINISNINDAYIYDTYKLKMVAYSLSLASYIAIGFFVTRKITKYKFEREYYRWSLLHDEQMFISSTTNLLENNNNIEEHTKEVMHQLSTGYIFDVEEALKVLTERTAKLSKENSTKILLSQI